MLGKVALVKNDTGLVENLIIIGEHFNLKEGYSAIPIDTHVSIGDIWDGKKFLQMIDEESLLNSLIPKVDEITQADFELRAITLLMEVGLL